MAEIILATNPLILVLYGLVIAFGLLVVHAGVQWLIEQSHHNDC